MSKATTKRGRSLPYLVVFLVPLMALTGYALGGVGHFTALIFVFGVIPLVDLLVGIDPRNVAEGVEEDISQRWSFRLITMLTTPVQVALLLWGAYVVTRGGLGPWEAVGLTIAVGISGGIVGINPAHEMVHKIDSKIERFLAHVSLLSVSYMHWGDEHVKGHHRHVATPLDPTTAQRGESFYAFFPRTLWGTIRLSWQLEAERLERAGSSLWSPRNRMIWFTLLPLGLALGLVALTGSWWALAYYFGQSFVAIWLLEITNYIEHYGLQRKKLDNGRYERVTPLHSWNASHWLTNYFLFNLQRHSDHHAKPRRRYQILRHFEQSPQLPTGYAGMILVALIPPLWRRMMDQRLEQHQEQLRQSPELQEATAAEA